MEDGNVTEESRKCTKTSVISEPPCNEFDYISQMPAEILVLILDKLPMEDAWPTCILAKRWKNLWCCKTDVVFDGNWVKRWGDYVFDAAERFMHCRQGQTIQRLSLSLPYKGYMRDSVKNWIMSALENNVEEICIDLNGAERRLNWRNHPDFCLLPDFQIECSTLVKLTLKYMTLQMLPTCFRALKELYLEEVELAAHAVEKITSICLSLTLLSLTNCNLNSNLKIKISINCNLLKLIINEGLDKVDDSKRLYLDAPSVTAIEFASAIPRRTYRVENVLLVDQVKFNLEEMSVDPLAVEIIACCTLHEKVFYDNFFKLCSAFQSADEIIFSSWCVQILALENMFTYINYAFAASHLVLEMALSKKDFGGLIYMLNACDSLKKVSIVITKAVEFTFHCLGPKEIEDNPYYRMRDTEDLPMLEVVEFKDYLGHDRQAKDSFCFDEARFLSGTESGLVALSFLKSKAKNLRSLIFDSRKFRYETDLQKGTYSYFKK